MRVAFVDGAVTDKLKRLRLSARAKRLSLRETSGTEKEKEKKSEAAELEVKCKLHVRSMYPGSEGCCYVLHPNAAAVVVAVVV